MRGNEWEVESEGEKGGAGRVWEGERGDGEGEKR